MNLRIPGPTPCPPEVLQAGAHEMINHRGPEFAALIASLTSRLKRWFQTEGDLFILTGSGTGGMEAAIVNTISPGDRVLAVGIGGFGDRFAEIAEVFGAQVVRLNFPWGQAADPDEIRQALAADPTLQSVLITHNETSTGVTNDLQAIGKVVKEAGRLLIVDAISSIGSIDLQVDAWGCDVVISASQKGWMIPPGLALVSVSKDAWAAWERARTPRLYWDFGQAQKYLQIGQTPWTPAVSLFFAMDKALDLMEEEGMPNVFARHARVGRFTREGVQRLGLELFPVDLARASNTVTTFKLPAGVDSKSLLQTLQDKHSIVLAGGQGKLSGKVARIGHLGYVYEEHIDAVLQALEASLPARTV